MFKAWKPVLLSAVGLVVIAWATLFFSSHAVLIAEKAVYGVPAPSAVAKVRAPNYFDRYGPAPADPADRELAYFECTYFTGTRIFTVEDGWQGCTRLRRIDVRVVDRR